MVSMLLCELLLNQKILYKLQAGEHRTCIITVFTSHFFHNNFWVKLIEKQLQHNHEKYSCKQMPCPMKKYVSKFCRNKCSSTLLSKTSVKNSHNYVNPFEQMPFEQMFYEQMHRAFILILTWPQHCSYPKWSWDGIDSFVESNPFSGAKLQTSQGNAES